PAAAELLQQAADASQHLHAPRDDSAIAGRPRVVGVGHGTVGIGHGTVAGCTTAGILVSTAGHQPSPRRLSGTRGPTASRVRRPRIHASTSASIHPTAPGLSCRRAGKAPRRSRRHNDVRDNPLRAMTSASRRTRAGPVAYTAAYASIGAPTRVTL